MDKYDECQTPFTKCWCEAVPARANNPHCQDAITNVPIDNPIFIIIMMFLGMICFFLKPTKLK